MANKAAREKKIRTIIAVSVAVLAIGFGAAWLYMQYQEKRSREVTYFKLPSIAISHNGHSISATFAVRTSAADAGWASRNQAVLADVMKHALLAADPAEALAPGGLKTLQDKVRETSNATLRSERIQEVLITDFLVSEGDR